MDSIVLEPGKGAWLRLLAVAGYGFLSACATGFIGQSGTRADETVLKKSGKVDFKSDIAPILQQRCIDCHGSVLKLGGVRLDQRRFALVEGQMRGLVVPGNSEESLLIQRLTDKSLGLIMPPSFPFFPGEKVGLPDEQIAVLKRWIDEGADWPDGMNLTADSGMSSDSAAANAFFAAIRRGDRKAVAEMLADRLLLKSVDRHGSTALMQAALYSDATMMRLLLERGADSNATNKDGATALMWGAGDVEKVRLLLEQGARIDVKTALGRTPLLVAATYAGNSAVVRLLLERGGKVNDQDIFHETALTSAAKRGDAELVEVLLAAGADVAAGGRPPLAWAAEEGNLATVAALLKHGAADDKNGLNQALFNAAVRGPHAAVLLLLEHGGDPNARSGFAGYTPLMGAAYSELKSIETLKSLLKKGGDVQVKGANGETALSLAKKRGHTDVVEILQHAGAVE